MRGRIRIAELYGSKRGAVTDAINEAVKLWLKETSELRGNGKRGVTALNVSTRQILNVNIVNPNGPTKNLSTLSWSIQSSPLPSTFFVYIHFAGTFGSGVV